MNILITGGCGFIGSHIAEFHLAKGDTVRVVDDLSTGSLNNIAVFQSNPAFHFIDTNIVDWPTIREDVVWADRIYHMAAVIGVFRVLAEPINVLSTNITGCEKLLDAVAETNSSARIMIASSSSVYGHSEKPCLNENDKLVISTVSHPLRHYAISKIADEALGLAFFSSKKMPITLLRFFNTVGPRQTGRYGMVVPRFVEQACKNEPLTIFGDGHQTRSFCDVRDVVAMLDELAQLKECEGQIINVGRDTEVTINELAELVRERANSQSIFEYIPYEEAYGMNLVDIEHRRPDLGKLRSMIAYQHKWTLEKTVDDLIQRYQVGK